MKTAQTIVRSARFMVALLAAGAGLSVSADQASASLGWRIDPLSNSTVEAGGTLDYTVQVTNTGNEPTFGPIEVSGTLPAGMVAQTGMIQRLPFIPGTECTAADGVSPIGGASSFKCVFEEEIAPWNLQKLLLTVAVDPGASGILTPRFEVSGGGAGSASTLSPVTVSAQSQDFGLNAFDVAVTGPTGAAFTQASGHPDAVTTSFDFNTGSISSPLARDAYPVESIKDVLAELPPGFIGNPTGIERCAVGDLVHFNINLWEPLCSTGAQVGTLTLRVDVTPFLGTIYGPLPLYNVLPPPGVPARFGTVVLGTPIVLDARVRSDGSYALAVDSRDIPSVLGVAGSLVTFWGSPGSSAHDGERACPGRPVPSEFGPTCTSGREDAFLRNPTSCRQEGEGAPWSIRADSWEDPGAVLPGGDPDLGDAAWSSRSIESHETPGYPRNPADPSTPWGEEIGITGCEDVPVKGEIEVLPTSQDAETATGLNVVVSVPNPGLDNPSGIASSDVRRVKVSLPEGMTINPSQGDGLGTCSPTQYASTQLSFYPDGTKGCPANSKIGTVTVKTPLLVETLEGSVFVAKPHDNPFNSLVALYIVIENPERGVLIKIEAKVEPDERTGQLVTTTNELPQLPFSSFSLRFREGVRSPLSTPRTCGSYVTTAEFTPWSDPSRTITRENSFQITKGVGAGPCPSGSIAPFAPKLSAGSINNNALSYSPFSVRMSREDGEQELTRFSADLPPGLAAKLAGVTKCSEADLVATARAPGFATIQGSICPTNSQVGRVTVGFGVGSVLTRATGRVFLAGPYQGAPVSIATVAPAVVGPFDLGTVVQRSAFTVDPETAEVHIDSRASDPIPHILKGFELHLRDVRVYMDRPGFTFNPTSCDRDKVGAFLDGSGTDFFSSADDPRVDVTNPFQAANCSLLPFKPKLSFKLRGGTKRGDFPALRAILKGRPGDANLSKVVVALPKSQFLEQDHIGTVCTRVQFAAENCPAASIYGSATATTPLLDRPLSGPVYLRSSNNQLPDLVIALRGEIAVNAVGRIDSVNGGIRSTFDTIPDTPIDTFTLRMQGGKKGLLVNSRNLCLKPARVDVRLTGQNGKVLRAKPKMGVKCGKGRRVKK